MNRPDTGLGYELALGDDGRLLAISDALALASARVSHRRLLAGIVYRGAVYLYQRSESGAWPLSQW